MPDNARLRAEELDFWDGPVTARPLSAGPCGARFLVIDEAGEETAEYVVWIGDDQPEHGVFRYNEIVISQAAYDAGISPALVHHEPGALVFEHLRETATVTAGDLGEAANMDRLIGLLGQCHLDLPGHLEAPGPMFWAFQLNRRYARIIMQHGGALAPALTRLMALNDELEGAIGAIHPVFCHNNLSAETILDDGQGYRLIDWCHGGWNDGLYDLACLAANLDLGRAAEAEMLRRYSRLTDEDPDQTSRRKFAAWKCAALLWSGLWGGEGDMFAGHHFDFSAHSQQRLEHLERATSEFREI